MFLLSRTGGRLMFAASLAAAACGCGKSDVASRVAASGRIDVAGRPAPDGMISFAPLGPGGGPAATTAVQDGRYQFSRKQGPPPGRHRVIVIADSNDKRQRFGASKGDASSADSGLAPDRWQTEVDVPDEAECDLPIRFDEE